jgi:hypothetical protein
LHYKVVCDKKRNGTASAAIALNDGWPAAEIGMVLRLNQIVILWYFQ